MFGKIAKLFKKSAPKQSETPFAPESAPKSDTQALRRGQFGGPGADASASQTRLFKRRKGDAAGEIDSISLPFAAILQLVPKELHGKMAAGVSNALSYNLPKAVALEQLSRGAVKVAFGDLRRAAPAGLFAGSGGHDSRLVDLPLREILNRLDPEAFARRATQNRVSIPEDVTDIFGAKGERLTDVRVVSKSELKTAGQKSAAQPAAAPAEPPSAPIRFPSSAAPQVEQPAAPLAPAAPIPFTPLKAPAAPAAPASKPAVAPAAQTPAIPLPSMGAVPKVPGPAAAVPKIPAPAIGKVSKPVAAPPSAPTPAPALPPNAIRFPTPVAPVPAPQVPATPVAPPAAPVSSGGALSVSVNTISQKWPEAIRKSIHQIKATDVEIPNELIAAGLKSGKVEFQWQQFAAWLRPVPQGNISPDEAETVLELPLSIIAPLFLQQSKYKAKQSNVPAGIPDLFSAKGEKLAQAEIEEEEEEEAEEEEQPAAVPQRTVAHAPVATPAAPVAPAAPYVPAVIPDRQRAQNLAQLFGEPNKKNWTPNEIVHKTITMPGVMGALIALQDGLLVAGSMPPPWKTETIAAFIPQIFGRLTQYTKELQMGEVHTVSFGVEAGTLQIFNAGIIYFGALGKHGDTMPVEDLTLIASELSRHTK